MASRVGIPRIIAYVFVGILFSQDILGGVLHFNLAETADVPTIGALGIIAYIIGGSITTAQLKRIGAVIFSTAMGESMGAMILVCSILVILFPVIEGINGIQLALPLAAIAATTDAASTLAVLHQYRARGVLTDTLLGVVALDDVLGIIFYSLALVYATGAGLSTHLGAAIWEIIGSIVLGGLTGLILARLGSHVRQPGLRLPLILGGVFTVIGCAEALGLSALLSSMVLGFSARHFMKAAADRLFAPIELLEELVFLIFFTLAGAHFQFAVMIQYADIIFFYFVARMIGKLIGSVIGARIAGAPARVSRWLGLGLVPQAGIAVGLALSLSQETVFQAVGPMIINIILGTTILYELTGPFAVRYAIQLAGEIGSKRSGVLQ